MDDDLGDDERLITEVERHAVIYDPNDPFYKDKARKDRAWNQIAGAVGVDCESCRNRWKALRDSFVKNNKKSLPKGSASGTVKWKYAEIMSFLLPHVKSRSPRGHFNRSKHGEERSATPQSFSGCEDRPSTPGISFQQPSTSPAPSTSVAFTPRSRSPRERTSRPAVAVPRRGQSADTGIEEPLMSPLEPKLHMPYEELEESYHFALSIVPVLHRLQKDRRQQAKIEILTVLHKLEKGQGNQQAPPPP